MRKKDETDYHSIYSISLGNINGTGSKNNSIDRLKVMSWNIWYGFFKLEEHMARIDFILASSELNASTIDARIIHHNTSATNYTVLIDEMTDYFPIIATFNLNKLTNRVKK